MSEALPLELGLRCSRETRVWSGDPGPACEVEMAALPGTPQPRGPGPVEGAEAGKPQRQVRALVPSPRREERSVAAWHLRNGEQVPRGPGSGRSVWQLDVVPGWTQP